MQAIILAAGTSTRARPLTYTRPKPLLPILDTTILEHDLDQLVGIVDEVIIAEFYLAEMIQSKIGSEYKGMKIIHVRIDGTPGTGGTVSALRKYLRDRFLVLNADDLISAHDIARLVQHERGALVSTKATLTGSYDGWKIEKGNIIALHSRLEKNPPTWGVATGVYVLGEEYFDLPPVKISIRDEVGLPHTLASVLSKTEYVAVDVEDYWIPTGYPWDLIDANLFLLAKRKDERRGTIEPGVYINGKVIVGENSVIRSGTIIDGDAFIGKNCIIGPNAYLRGGVVIGDHSHIGFGAEVKRSVIFDHVDNHHHGYIGDSVIGSYCNIGAGTVVGNLRHDNTTWKTLVRGEEIDTGQRKLGAFLGDFCKTAIHTSLVGGALLGPASWTDSNDKVKGVVPPFHIGSRELPLEKFEKLPYYEAVKQFQERLAKEEKA